MFKRTLLVLLFFTSVTKAGVVWEPPVIIDPPNPQVGDMVKVGLFERYYPPCLGIPQENSIGETHSLLINQSDIKLDVLAITDPMCNPFPADPAPREYYDLGVLAAGEYTLNVNYIQVFGFQPADIPPFPLPDYFFTEAFGEPISFNVRGLPQKVSTLSYKSTILLVTLFLFSFIIIGKDKCLNLNG